MFIRMLNQWKLIRNQSGPNTKYVWKTTACGMSVNTALNTPTKLGLKSIILHVALTLVAVAVELKTVKFAQRTFFLFFFLHFCEVLSVQICSSISNFLFYYHLLFHLCDVQFQCQYLFFYLNVSP